MAKRISIINFKGGVGKTTLAFHLGTGLAKFHNARVLLIDVDHQSSLSIAASHGYIIPVVPVYDRKFDPEHRWDEKFIYSLRN